MAGGKLVDVQLTFKQAMKLILAFHYFAGDSYLFGPNKCHE